MSHFCLDLVLGLLWLNLGVCLFCLDFDMGIFCLDLNMCIFA